MNPTHDVTADIAATQREHNRRVWTAAFDREARASMAAGSLTDALAACVEHSRRAFLIDPERYADAKREVAS